MDFISYSLFMDYLTSRREFLKFVSNQSIAIGLSPLAAAALSACQTVGQYDTLTGLSPNREDKLKLIEGLHYNLVAQWGDRINGSGESFGFNNDFTCYFPIEGKINQGLLWVNHESVIPEFIHNKARADLSRSVNEIIKEQEAVGGSIIHIRKSSNKWELLADSKYNRRVHGRTKIPFCNEFVVENSRTAVGTLANCAGGKTPWNTVLTSEENFDDFYGDTQLINKKRVSTKSGRYDWHKQFPLPPEHYGWVVEVDPFTGRAEKQILLGRAPHEGATVVTTKDQRAVVYMGEDREGGFLYKFVSEGLHFKKGTLYAADTITGRWLPLVLDTNKKLQKLFDTQLQVLTYAHQAAEAVGATPQDRPEDIEVHPETGHLFVALTKNLKVDNPYGSLLKIAESSDHDSLDFQASTWVSGGLKTGLACPDNLCFDKNNNLWVTTDVSEKEMGQGPYSDFGHNGLFFVPTTGPSAGIPILVATAPVDAELTGPWFSPDYKTLFLSVQHPGSGTAKNLKRPTSTFPHGKAGKLPRPAVVAIEGPLFETLMS